MKRALDTAIESVLARARETARPRWIAWVETASSAEPGSGPGSDIDAAAARGDGGDRFAWERIEAGARFSAEGALEELESEGPDRFSAIREWHDDLVGRLEWHGAPRPSTRPLLVGGFGFEPRASSDPDWKSFPAARFVLPEAIVECFAGEARVVVFARVEPGDSSAKVRAELDGRLERAGVRAGAASSAPMPTPALAFEREAEGPEYRVRADRSHARFRAQVAEALAEIVRGGLSKLVLARSLSVSHDADFDVAGFRARLRALYPSCTLVAVGRGRDTFLAATPETLVRVAGERVETAALAGSAPRGRTPEEDAALASALFASPKERAEHAHVVAAMRAALAPRCSLLEIAPTPRLRALFGIQHLETAISGRLEDPRDAGALRSDVLALVEALHPTPAVAGAPAVAATDWLRRNEGLERGWYAAPIGWLDAEGGGDFCVGLRSALIRNGLAAAGRWGASRARLFAGAGIVAGSDPEQELVETRIKLRALLAPLTEI